MLISQKILIAPLDWGLGHATRCVPLIRELQKNNSIILGVTPVTRNLFNEEFPGVRQIDFPSYNIRYSSVIPLWLKLGMDYPRIAGIISEENKLLEKVITDEKIDVVISDNRFGLHTKKAQTIFLTHQLFLKAPVFSSFANSLNRKYVLKFDEVWIPDYENESESLSGELSHGHHFHSNLKYIGPQSRLADAETFSPEKNYDYLALLSGPEPQRSLLEEKILKEAPANKSICIVRGIPDKSKAKSQKSVRENITVFDFPSKQELKRLILSSEKIICRSGYSTLMDMHLLRKKDLILIPTPGQSEQEYLAEYWEKKFNTVSVSQNTQLKL